MKIRECVHAMKFWVEKYDVRSALLHHTSSESAMLAPALYKDPDWSLVYYDFAASFFVRNDALGTAQPIVFSSRSSLPTADMRPDARFILNAFYRNMGLKPLLLANLEQLVPSGLHKRNVFLEIAKTNLALNNLGKAEFCFLQLLDVDSSDTEALSELSFIYYQG